MSKIKLKYLAPAAETLTLRFEGALCTSPGGYTEGGGGNYSDDEINNNGSY